MNVHVNQTMPDHLEEKKSRAAAWFAELRDSITAAFEGLEETLPANGPLADRPPSRFVRTPWKRTDHTGADGGGGPVRHEQAAAEGPMGADAGLEHAQRVGGREAVEHQAEAGQRPAAGLEFLAAAADRATADAQGAELGVDPGQEGPFVVLGSGDEGRVQRAVREQFARHRRAQAQRHAVDIQRDPAQRSRGLVRARAAILMMRRP